jgi:hypothetical protein
MRYEVEIGWGFELDGPFADQVIESELDFPYYVASFVGDQPGRFRVRGKNSLGEGEWSEYRYFDFTPHIGRAAEQGATAEVGRNSGSS